MYTLFEGPLEQEHTYKYNYFANICKQAQAQTRCQGQGEYGIVE